MHYNPRTTLLLPMNITYVAALLEQANRPRINNSPGRRAETARVLSHTARMMRKVARDLKRAGITLSR